MELTQAMKDIVKMAFNNVTDNGAYYLTADNKSDLENQAIAINNCIDYFNLDIDKVTTEKFADYYQFDSNGNVINN